MRTSPLFRRTVLSSFIAMAGVSLVACGGGGGSSTSTSATPTGTVNMSVTDGPGDDYTHVWVTINEVALHTDPNAVWSASDASWVTYTLPSPVTIDLASKNNGALDTLIQGLNLPAGTYRQVRFFLNGAETNLTASASNTDSSNGALLWNDQVEYVQNGTTKEAPLEIAYPVQGLQLSGNFVVGSGSTLNLAVDFDLEHSVVPFNHNGYRFFTLKPVFHYVDLSQAGAITGQIDTTNLCTDPNTSTSGCAYNLIIKAELLSSDGSRHVDEHSTVVRSDGSFTLFPLPVTDASGNALKYDVLIRGRQMDTMLITGVPVTAGATASSGATALSTGPITPVINSNEYTAQFATALAPLTSGYALFQQTLSGGVPYEVRFGLTDPFSGKLLTPMPLVNGDFQLASYVAGSAPSFTDTQPTEGTGDFSVAVNEAMDAYYTRSANTQLDAVSAGSATTFTPGTPTLNSGVADGTVSGTIENTNSGGYDHGQLVIAHAGTIVTSFDFSSQIASSSIPFNLSGLPAGSATTAQPGAYYYAYIRLWKTADSAVTKAHIVPYIGLIDLHSNNTATFNVAVP